MSVVPIQRVESIAVLKLGMSMRPERDAGVAQGEALAISEAFSEHFTVHVFTKPHADIGASKLVWHDIDKDTDTSLAQVLVVFNGKPDVRHPDEQTKYQLIEQFRGPVFYVMCDPELPMLKPELPFPRFDIHVLTQAYEVEELARRWRTNPATYAISNVSYFPFEQFALLGERLPFNPSPVLDLAYGGSARGGRRLAKLHQWYFGLPFDIDAELFGKISIADFADLSPENAPAFGPSVEYGDIATKMNTAMATVVCGDASYEELDVIPHRVYEAMAANCLVFVDAKLDPARRIFRGSANANFFYVATKASLVEKLRQLKRNPALRKQMLQLQHDVVGFDKTNYLLSLSKAIT